MPDFKVPTQDAFFARLSPLQSMQIEGNPVGVFQHVPDEREPPFVFIASVTAEPVGGKDGGFDRVSVEVLSVVREPAKALLFQLMTAVRDQIEGAVLSATGVQLSPPAFEGDDDDLLDDGVTYAGTQRFTLFAQPAD